MTCRRACFRFFYKNAAATHEDEGMLNSDKATRWVSVSRYKRFHHERELPRVYVHDPSVFWNTGRYWRFIASVTVK